MYKFKILTLYPPYTIDSVAAKVVLTTPLFISQAQTKTGNQNIHGYINRYTY